MTSDPHKPSPAPQDQTVDQARARLLLNIGADGDCPGCCCSFCGAESDADSYVCADCGRLHSTHEWRTLVDALIAACLRRSGAQEQENASDHSARELVDDFVGSRELRASLSAILVAVRSGSKIAITLEGSTVAQLVPPGTLEELRAMHLAQAYDYKRAEAELQQRSGAQETTTETDRGAGLAAGASDTTVVRTPELPHDAPCLNCGHSAPHTGYAGGGDGDDGCYDACTHEGCNCGWYTPDMAGTEPRPNDLDVCECGDLRKEHDNGEGWCRTCAAVSHMQLFDVCRIFRQVSRVPVVEEEKNDHNAALAAGENGPCCEAPREACDFRAILFELVEAIERDCAQLGCCEPECDHCQRFDSALEQAVRALGAPTNEDAIESELQAHYVAGVEHGRTEALLLTQVGCASVTNERSESSASTPERSEKEQPDVAGTEPRPNRLAPAAEYVHHLHECPSIGGNGDLDCRCGAVSFLALVDSQSVQLSAAVSRLASITEAADAFARGDISSGKLAEVLGCSDKHGFKTSAHAFCDHQVGRVPVVEEEKK